MLATIFTKSLLDRWKSITVASMSLGVLLLFGMAVYRDVDLSIYADMPEAMRSLMNIGDDVDAGGLAFGAIYGSYGALTLASLALSMGGASIAGEERDGTIGLLLANPKSRTRVLAAKLGGLVALTTAGVLMMWAAGVAIPAALGVDTGRMHLGALMLHIGAISLFFGMLGAAVGGWTGRRGLASGVTAGVMVVSFFASGLLPLVAGWEHAARAFPWHYYDSGQPVFNGVAWGDLAVLMAGSVVCAVIALVGVSRRDLREHGVAVTLLDRLRRSRVTRRLAERFAGAVRVSGVTAKSLSDHQMLTVAVGATVLLFGVMMGPLYLLIDEAIAEFAENIPEVLLSMVGYADMATPQGWYQTENFSMTIPIALIVVTTVMGSRALAGEEADRTMGLLLANPISRIALVRQKAVAMAVATILVGVLVFIGTAAGSAIAGLGMSIVGIAATSTLAVLLALVFGALALAIGAAAGRVKLAAFGTAGAALSLYVLDVIVPLTEGLSGLARWSPFHYYLGSDPLNNGMPWGDAGVLAVLTVGLLGAALTLFGRRDLRQSA